MRALRYVVVAMMPLMAAGCTSTNFLVYKNSKHFYITSNGRELKQVLCDSGDMDRVNQSSRLPDPLQKELKEEICSSGKVRERLMATLDRMTKEQRSALKQAFRDNGYDINVIANC